MLSRQKLWLARQLRKAAQRIERKALSPGEVKKYFEDLCFETWFPKNLWPDGPPPPMFNTTRNPARTRIVKGTTPGPVVTRTKDDEVEVWVEDTPTTLIGRRKQFGDLQNTVDNLMKRGVIPGDD